MTGRSLSWRWLGTLDYREAWSLQQRLASARRLGQLTGDLLLLLEHPPVFTMGRRGDPRHLGGGPAALRAAGAEYVEVDRGGSVTFHGPGQLVAYPIVDLASAFPVAGQPGMGDVLRYLRALEEALMRTAEEFGCRAERRPPYTGVWHGTDKLAAIGVKLAGGITTHGVALNVCTDLEWFSLVTPCGIEDAGVCSLASLGAPGLTPAAVAPTLAVNLAGALGSTLAAAPEIVAAAVV